MRWASVISTTNPKTERRTETMAGNAYISNGELHISLGSEDWIGYCDFLKTKLEALEEQRKTLDDRIREIHAILNPPKIVIDVEDDEEQKEDADAVVTDDDLYMFDTSTITTAPTPVEVTDEKYLLPKDIASKYKVTSDSVVKAVEMTRIPGHRVGGEWRFTQSDVELISSKYARDKTLFTPKQAKGNIPKVIINKRPRGKLTASEVITRLGITEVNYNSLKNRGLLVGKSIDGKTGSGSHLYFDEKEVVALGEMIRADGGIKPFLSNLRKTPATTATAATTAKKKEGEKVS